MTLQARTITLGQTLLVADYDGLVSSQLVQALNKAFNSFHLPPTIRFSADTDYRHSYDTNRQIGLLLTLDLGDLSETTTTALLRALYKVFQDDTLVHYSDLTAETAICTYKLGKDRKLSVRQHVAG